jgi:hypothetical protein
MVDPGRVKGDHDIFVNGNAAKAQVTEILRQLVRLEKRR